MENYFKKKIDNLISSNETSIGITEDDLKHYPRFLYKYRSGKNDYDFQMIEEQYLWADMPCNFDDPFDAIVKLKLEKELPSIEHWIDNHMGEIVYYSISPKGMHPHKRGQSLSNYKKAQSRFLDDSGKYDAQKAELLMAAETKKLPIQAQMKLREFYEKLASPEFEKVVRESVETTIENVVNSLRNKYMVCCLTARKDNQKMWEGYADTYSGFAIEYDLKKCQKHPECSGILSRTFPVKYYQRRPSVSLLPFIEADFYKKLYGKDVLDPKDMKKLFKQLLIKKDDYIKEEEWRMISPDHRIEFPIISAVYAGYKIPDEKLERLKSICRNRKIKLYKQRPSLSGKFEFDLI